MMKSPNNSSNHNSPEDFLRVRFVPKSNVSNSDSSEFSARTLEELSDWIDIQLEELEGDYPEFATAGSQRQFFGRG